MNEQKNLQKNRKKERRKRPVSKREMQDAINYAYVNPNQRALSVPRKSTVPTVEEFVAYSVRRINKETDT